MSFDWNEFNDDMRDLQKLKKLNEINENLKRNQPPSRPLTPEENKQLLKKILWMGLLITVISFVAMIVMVVALTPRY